jgi:large subunit ribosomal protein L21
MRVKIGALLAAAAASAAGAAAWAKRKRDEDEPQPVFTRSAGTVETKVPEAPEPATEPAAAATGDDLTTVKGIGAVSQGRLKEVGVTTFAEIAAWSDEDLDSVAEQIKVSSERMRREDWVGQARAIVEA